MESRIAGRAYLASVAAEARGGSLRLLCPFCDGGPDRELSLVLTIRDDGTFYCCHRASCGEKGAIGAKGRALARGPIVPESQKNPPFTGELVAMRHDDPARRRFNKTLWGQQPLEPINVGLYTDVLGEREHWVLRNTIGKRVGVQVRWTTADGKRVKTYKETSGPVYTAYGTYDIRESHKETWIVEDPLSAALIYSWGYPAIALCGTYLSFELAVELAKTEDYTSGFMVALDPGAEDAARRVCYTLAATTMLPVQVRFITCDIKDMNLEQLRDIGIARAV